MLAPMAVGVTWMQARSPPTHLLPKVFCEIGLPASDDEDDDEEGGGEENEMDDDVLR